MHEIHRPSLSAHAYRRFCERFHEASREMVAAHVLSRECRMWLSWGANRIYHHRGMNIVAREGEIITLWPASWGRSRRYD